jgi:hypothetical protein
MWRYVVISLLCVLTAMVIAPYVSLVITWHFGLLSAMLIAAGGMLWSARGIPRDATYWAWYFALFAGCGIFAAGIVGEIEPCRCPDTAQERSS